MGKKKAIEKNGKSKELYDIDWQENLRREIESTFEQTKVTILAKTLFKDYGMKEDVTVYDVIIVSPMFQDHDYEERINMIWPVFVKIPDPIFKQIYGVDCQTPAEHHRKVA